MAATGELIRLINYVDDIVTTLRRISASIPMMDAEEKTRLAEHLRAANSNLTTILGQLEKGGQ
jgi:chromosome segregation ATPase